MRAFSRRKRYHKGNVGACLFGAFLPGYPVYRAETMRSCPELDWLAQPRIALFVNVRLESAALSFSRPTWTKQIQDT
jgi:hypothetical protein